MRNRAELKLRKQIIDISYTMAEMRQTGKMLSKSYQRLFAKRSKLQQKLKANGIKVAA
jgi:hypothetical protein